MSWSEYPKQMMDKRAALAALDEKFPGIVQWANENLVPTEYYTDGIDNSPEGIELLRTELIEQRTQMLDTGVMEQATLLSHVIVLLAELKDIKERQARLPETIRSLKAQAQEDLKNMEKE